MYLIETDEMCVEIELTSERDINYNCFAWAAEDQDTWWGPSSDDYWPAGIAREVTLEAYIHAYETIEYEICESELHEAGYEKIAIYVNHLGKPIHASRQLSNGRWTSKVGEWEDIGHEFARDLVIQINEQIVNYGTIKVILRRPISEN
jgi:hypothetical protein